MLNLMKTGHVNLMITGYGASIKSSSAYMNFELAG
jgi:hypothetical protein